MKIKLYVKKEESWASVLKYHGNDNKSSVSSKISDNQTFAGQERKEKQKIRRNFRTIPDRKKSKWRYTGPYLNKNKCNKS